MGCISAVLSRGWFSLLAAVVGVAVAGELWGQVAVGEGNPLGMRMYVQEVTLEFGSTAEAEAAVVTPAPVFGGKAWAFTGRWDDNNAAHQQMHDAMAKHGLLGTFYLNELFDSKRNSRNYTGEYTTKLLEGGFSIGGHTQTHPMVPGLNPNEMFYEVLANRVEREAETGRPINSFAFPFGRFDTPVEPRVMADLTTVFLRAGFIDTPYVSFARRNPSAKPFEISTSHEVKPGDTEVRPAEFDSQMEKLLSGREAAQAVSYGIHLGVHVRQTGKAWEDLDGVFAKYAHRDDWWYCNESDYAAYDRQWRSSTVEPGEVAGRSRRYRLTRPIPAELGTAVPLTLRVRDGGVGAVTATGAECSVVGGGRYVNVGHSGDRKLPSRIELFENKENALVPPAPLREKVGSGLMAWLSCDNGVGELQLSVENRSAAAATELQLTLRLPPRYVDGLRRMDVGSLAGGERRVLRYPLGAVRPERIYQDGRAYFVAEVNAGEKRVFATTRLPAPTDLAVSMLEAVSMMGPLSADVAGPEGFVSMSVPTVSLVSVGEQGGAGLTRQWFAASASDKLRYSSERATLFRDDQKWRDIASKAGAEQVYAVAMDFELSEKSEVKLLHEGVLQALCLNGESVTPGKSVSGAKKGMNRMILLLALKDGRKGTAYPVIVRMTPATGDLRLKPAARP